MIENDYFCILIIINRQNKLYLTIYIRYKTSKSKTINRNIKTMAYANI